MRKRYAWVGPYQDYFSKGISGMMRCLFLILVTLIFCVIGCNDAEKSSSAKTLDVTAKTLDETAKSLDVTAKAVDGLETREYEIFGMDCPGCHGGLEKLIKKIPAIQDAQANWVKKQVIVTVKADAKLSDDDVYDAIKRSNFTVGKRTK
jgi:copper chaperone CopZ